jgi:TonB family protein
LLVLGAIDWKMGWTVSSPIGDSVADAPAAIGGVGPVAFVALTDEIPPGLPLEHFTGPGDDGNFDDTHPFPRADIDMAGRRAAAAGGGDVGGTDTYTGRSGDDADLRTEMWNSDDEYRRPRTRTGRDVTSDESINRDRSRDYGDRTDPRTHAVDGAEQGRSGLDTGDGPGHGGVATADRDWDDADPMFDGAAGARAPQRRDGSTTPTRQRALVDDGDAANEAPRRGDKSDRVNTAAASNETDPMPIEFTTTRSGGDADGTGVAGDRSGDGVSTRSTRHDGDTAGTSTDTASGSGRIAVSAKRQNPYFRRMYSRLDKKIVFPKDLALSMDQGEVIVTFTLNADGSVGAVRVKLSSRFEQFDKAVIAAVKAAAPFGKVPTSVLEDKDAIVVKLPYAFRNRMIR